MLQKEFKELLPETIRDAMTALEETSNATDEITIPVLLSVATFATQGLANGFPGIQNWDKCAINNYFCVLVPSGGLKTSISDSVLEGARRFELDQRPRAEDAETDYKVAMGRYEKEIRDKIKQSSNPIVTPGIATPFTKIVKPALPRTARYMSSKFTLNGLLNALTGVPHFGIFNSDAAEFFNSHAFKDPNSSIELVSAMSKLWSGEQIDKLTGIDDVITAGKRTTALFMLQQQLAGFFVNSQYKDQGFTNRILITQSEMVPKRPADFSGLNRDSLVRLRDDRLIRFNDRVYELLCQVDQQQTQPRTGGLAAMRAALTAQPRDANILALPTHLWNFEDATRQVFEAFYNDMLTKGADPAYEEYQNFVSRAYEHAVRLATVLSLFEGAEEIGHSTAICAVGLMYYFIDQRRHLTIDGSVRVSATVECSERVYRFVQDHARSNPEQVITRTVLNNLGPNSYRKMDAVGRDRVIAELLSRDLIRVEEIDKRTVITLSNPVA